MQTLNQYLSQTQRFLHDSGQQKFDPQNLIDYINRARREIAGRTQCCRVLTPISGSIISATVVQGGTGYSNQPNLVVTPPDFPSGIAPYPNGDQAIAQAVVQNGVITAVDIVYGGYGYFQPQLTVTDPTGSGAVIQLNVTGINVLKQGQETYSFSDIDLSAVPGAKSVLMIRSLSVIYANYRYSLPLYSMSVFQSMIAQFPFQYQYVPTFATQFGQGASGTFMVYPIPSQTYQWEFDCTVLPDDLIDNQSVDIIPEPWDDVVPYFAAHLGFAEVVNLNASKYYLDLFDQMCLRKSQYARANRTVNPYGRYILPFMLGATELLTHLLSHGSSLWL